eukprot:TRINITY_DN22213_c0_g1_i1.p1 TRINITY_DN22213_c0_g1~~TRINITY_DN22213_c0_g1_i1.p1  ORF type:complete len:188 (+),score=15.79 TRINITY_DN22213_c0_g1_i1:81-566(+)
MLRLTRSVLSSAAGAPSGVARSGPAVQRLVREHPDLADKLKDFRGSGHSGRILKRDVLDFLNGGNMTSGASSTSSSPEFPSPTHHPHIHLDAAVLESGGHVSAGTRGPVAAPVFSTSPPPRASGSAATSSDGSGNVPRPMTSQRVFAVREMGGQRVYVRVV